MLREVLGHALVWAGERLLAGRRQPAEDPEAWRSQHNYASAASLNASPAAVLSPEARRMVEEGLRPRERRSAPPPEPPLKGSLEERELAERALCR